MRSLPDTSTWLPKTDKKDLLSNSLLKTCQVIESRIKAESRIEKTFNIQNYDSGVGIEDVVRQQLRLILPERYSILPGVIVDDEGSSSGEVDIAITNSFWANLLKFGATPASRRVHISAESVYTIIEVKQTLTEASLDAAMKKIVMYKRLKRARSEYGRLIENHEIIELDHPDASLNYRFDTILAIGCKDGKEYDLVKRFFRINETLDREYRVNALTILGYGYAHYLSQAQDGEEFRLLYPETDMEYLNKKAVKRIIPVLGTTETESFHEFYRDLHSHLSLTALNFDANTDGYSRNHLLSGVCMRAVEL